MSTLFNTAVAISPLFYCNFSIDYLSKTWTHTLIEHITI